MTWQDGLVSYVIGFLCAALLGSALAASRQDRKVRRIGARFALASPVWPIASAWVIAWAGVQAIRYLIDVANIRRRS